MSTHHRTPDGEVPQTWVAIDIAKDLHVVLIATPTQRRLCKVPNTKADVEHLITMLAPKVVRNHLVSFRAVPPPSGHCSSRYPASGGHGAQRYLGWAPVCNAPAEALALFGAIRDLTTLTTGSVAADRSFGARTLDRSRRHWRIRRTVDAQIAGTFSLTVASESGARRIVAPPPTRRVWRHRIPRPRPMAHTTQRAGGSGLRRADPVDVPRR